MSDTLFHLVFKQREIVIKQNTISIIFQNILKGTLKNLNFTLVLFHLISYNLCNFSSKVSCKGIIYLFL